MEYGVFDHLDRGNLSLCDFYEARLKLVEVYDREGFYAYHLAEHHSTPLGMAPSPSVFLSAVAQRTARLRFGPLVYALPLHHPLRLIEEICMLDQLSGGRLEIGFGRGSSPMELLFYGQDPARAQRVYAEGLKLVLQGLSQKTLSFKGEFFSFENVPMELEPVQKPHPPLWYGVHSVESAERAGRAGLNIVSLDTARETRLFADCYRRVWRETGSNEERMPKIGLGRFIVVAQSDTEALAAARRAYPIWHGNFNHLYRLRGLHPQHPRPADFDKLMENGQGIAGRPETVAIFLKDQLAESQATYLLGQFAFGDLSLGESLRSVELFARQIAPWLA
jgi:alkanesulfonate monooxygenase SsuD/methylene tetrahydromethanopterin reductase-like flavin-dependent oxidoreductase (luciferase family)